MRWHGYGLAAAALLWGCSSLDAGSNASSSDAIGPTGTGSMGSSGGATDLTGFLGTSAGLTGSASASGSASESGPETTDATTSAQLDGWLEMGWGVNEFNVFEQDTLTVTLGLQGFEMLSVPLRGGGFPIQPEPSNIDHPNTASLTMWIDVEGIGEPGEYLDAYEGYKVPFGAVTGPDGDEIAEYVAVWFIIPDAVGGATLDGRTAYLHAELTCADRQVLVDDRVVTLKF